MDKYEYKVRAEEIKALIQHKEFTEALAVADTIDWRRVKSVMMLCTVSDIYKMNRRFDECKELLQLAYERHPGGRMIVYSLCELSVKMHETVQAIEYYKEFVQIAPKDSGRYILQYKLYEAQEVGLEERVAVLEEMKRRDYREKWAYELAYLYHRIGLSTRCVEECDELILWFGEGKYVTKAMELKMLHQPLSNVQEEKYQETGSDASEMQEMQEPYSMPIGIIAQNVSDASTMEIPTKDLDIHVNTIKVGQYDTINLQKELAESMKELLQAAEESEAYPLEYEEEEGPGVVTQAIMAPLLDETGELLPVEEVKEIFFEDSTAEMEQAAVLAEELKEEADITEAQGEGAFSNILSQEYDGQLSIVVPGGTQVEKQITGQMSIEDILAEWEKMKRENEQKRAEEVRQRVLEHTGSLFSEFDAQTRSGILAQLDDVYEKTLKKQAAPKIEQQEIPELEILDVQEEAEERLEPSETEEPASENADIPQEAIIPQEEIMSQDAAAEDGGEAESAEKPVQDLADASEEAEAEKHADRNLNEEEKELFGSFIQTKKEKNQIVNAIDAISLATYTGNVVITGETGSGTIELAKNLIKEVQISDANFSGKVAKITGNTLNTKNVDNTLSKMNNGALIIEKAGDLQEKTLDDISKYLDKGKGGIIIILEDTAKAVNRIFETGHKIQENFNARIDITALNNDALVAYGKKFAQELEYTIDELGVLALYTRIAEMQTSEHTVSAAEIREIVEDAIYHANRKTLRHLMDILLAKRYDEEDMIILRENDFI